MALPRNIPTKEQIDNSINNEPQILAHQVKKIAFKAGTASAGVNTQPFNFSRSGFDQMSSLGTRVVDSLFFRQGAYERLNGDEVVFSEINLQNILLEVNQRKNIVKTDIQGRNGSFKQYIGDSDFEISVSGLIVAKDHKQGVRPEEEIINFLKMCQSPEALTIESVFLDLFEIDTVVVDSYKLIQEEGKLDNQTFTMQLLSDTPVNLEIQENENARKV